MDIKKQVNRVIDSVIIDLKSGKYKLIEIGQFNSKLKYKDNVLEVWVANEEYGCRISSQINGLNFPEFDPETKKLVYKLATTKTLDLLRLELKEAKAKKSELFLEHKESVIAIKKIREEMAKIKP